MSATGPEPERVCFLLRVRSERLDEYRERHAAVWPEMLSALSAAGWHNYSLYLDDDGLLVGYLETPDFAAASRAMEGSDINARWQAEMAPFFVDDGVEAIDGGPPLRRLTEVFHLD